MSNRVLVNIQTQDWSVHFIGPDGSTQIWPCLPHYSHDEARKLLAWGKASPEEMVEHENSIRRWGVSSVVWELTDRQLDQLVQRGKAGRRTVTN